MIACVQGTVKTVRRESVVLMAGSIGYEIFVSNPDKYMEGSECFLWTYQQFREDGQFLYGFESNEEYELFSSLISVKGIGCKSALNILAKMPAGRLLDAIEQGDAAALKKLPGIGAKTAGQILLDLQGKIVLPKRPEAAPEVNDNWQQAHDALISLGYKPAEIAYLDREFGKSEEPMDVLLRAALQSLAKGKGMR